MTEALTAAVKDNLDGNTSLAHQLLSVYKSNEALGNKQEWSLDDIKGAAGAVFIAGADTVSQPGESAIDFDYSTTDSQTWATCVIFILNMVLHPEIQEKARNQLDSVIGTDRLPAFSDRGSLPYIEHIVQEVYRYVCQCLFEMFKHEDGNLD